MPAQRATLFQHLTTPPMTVDSTSQYGFGTKAIHAGAPVEPTTGAVIEPISLSTTYAQTLPANPIGYEYSRLANPNRDNFETAVAALEQAKYAIALGSGSAATALIVQSLPVDLHIVLGGDVYGGTHRYFTKVANTHGVSATFVPNLAHDLQLALRDNTRLVWLETPSNPTLSVTDLLQVAQILQQHEAATGNKVHLVVDNTFLSPYISNPLVHGADAVIHSVTKYINGHLDVVMGVIATSNDELHLQYRFLQNALGSVPLAFDSWLAHRGLKTLHLRVRQASTLAQRVAEFLALHSAVLQVNYPGLKLHANHAVVQRQHRDGLGGGMISFRVKGGAAGAAAFTSATKLFTLAESLGGIESLCEVPAVMTHGGIPQAERELNGVYDDLVRLLVGIEDAEDLVKDVEQALQKVQ